MSFKPTDEQEMILNSSGRVVKVAAFAGAGKSSTLRFFSARYPEKKILYIVFNRALVVEAQKTFPSNTTVVTGHGLAYRAVAGPYKHKIANSLKPFEVVALDCISFPAKATKETKAIMADGALKVITNFMQTSLLKIGDMDNRYLHDEVLKTIHLSCGTFNFYKKIAIELWNAMIDPGSLVPFVHDAYFKLYQLSMPIFEGFDVVFIDEAQDSNEVLLSILERQKHVRCFYVGDSHQSIYSFRRAKDAMTIVDHDEKFLLTGSFRFGQSLANVANVILRGYKNEASLIRGLGGDTRVLRPEVVEGEFVSSTLSGHAYVTRTNSGVFEKASVAADEGFNLRFVGGLSSYKLNQIVDAFYFSRGRKPFSEQLKHFNSFQEMREMSKALEDKELSSLVGLVMKLGDRIPDSAKKIKDQSVSGRRSFDKEITLTTAHRSKGLEFDHGELGNDFAKIYDPEEVTDEEVNLIYVAATRFRKSVCLSEVVVDAMSMKGAFN